MPDVVGTGVLRIEVDSSGVSEDVARVAAQADTTLQAKSKTSGDSAGKNFGDAYGKALKTKLTDAVKALPDANSIKLGINTDDATVRILAVRAELKGLSDQKIGIDISDADAMTKLAAIKAELKILSSSDNTQIRVDATQASAALAALDNELDTTKKKAEDAAGKGGEGGGGMGALVAAAVTLGPSLVPLGAVAGAALGSVALLAGSAALAVKGVTAEMKAGTDAGVQYTKGVGVVEGYLTQLETTAANSALGPFEQGVSDITKLMPDLNKEVGNFANIGGQIADHVLVGIIGGFRTMQPLINEIGLDLDNGALDFQKWTQNGGLQKFSEYAEEELPKVISTVDQLGHAIVTIVEDIAPLGGASLSSIKLISEVINELPVPVARDLVNVLAAGLVVWKGYQIVSTVGDWYDKAAKSLIAYTAAQKVSTAANALNADSAQAAAAADSLQATAEASDAAAASAETLAVRSEAAANALQGTSAAADTAGTAIKGAAGAASGIGGLGEGLAAIGAAGGAAIAAVAGVTLVAGAGALVLTHYTDAQYAQITQTKLLKQDVDSYTASLEQNNGVIDQNTTLIAAQSLQSSGLADKAAKAGISLADLTAGVTGTDAQFQALYQTWKDSGDPSNFTLIALDQQRNAFENGVTAANKFSEAVAATLPPQQDFNKDAATTASTINDINNAYGLSATQAQKYASYVGLSNDAVSKGLVSNDQYSRALAQVTTAEDSGTMSTSKYLAALDTFSGSADTASDKAALLGAVLVHSQGDLLGYEGAVAAGYAAVNNLTTAFQQQNEAVKAGTTAYSDTEKAAITYKQTASGLTADINLQATGAGALITQLQGLQTSAESAAEATYQHELATKGSAEAAADATTIFENLTGGALTNNAKQLGLTTAQAKALSTAYFAVPTDLTTQVQSIGLNDVNDTLNQLGQQLAFISGQPWTVKLTLEAAVAQIQASWDTAEARGSAMGNIFEFYAGGGMSENHTAQITRAKANTVRVWSEPETGGESYIPLSPAKRARSIPIWQETGKRLGVTSYDNGGISGGGASGSSLLAQMVDAMMAIAERPVFLQANGTQLAKVVNQSNQVLNRRN